MDVELEVEKGLKKERGGEVDAVIDTHNDVDQNRKRGITKKKQDDEVSFMHYNLEQMILSMKNIIGLLMEDRMLIGTENIEVEVQQYILIIEEKEKEKEIEKEKGKEKGEMVEIEGNQMRKTETEGVKNVQNVQDNQKLVGEREKEKYKIWQDKINENIGTKQMDQLLGSYENIRNAINRLPLLNMSYEEEKAQQILLMEKYHQTSKVLEGKLAKAKEIQKKVRGRVREAYNILLEEKDAN